MCEEESIPRGRQVKEDQYIVRGEYGKLKVSLTTTTYDSAIRAGKAVLKSFPECGTVSVSDRKGNVLKVVRRDE